MKSATIAIPTYNRPYTLKAALGSASRQTYSNLKIVVSDNASPGPETRNVVEQFMRDDERIAFHVQDSNIGANGNFLWLLNQADTNFFMWLGDDDEIKGENYIGELVSGFERDSSAKLVFPDVQIINDAARTDFSQLILSPHFANCESDFDYLLAWLRFGGGFPFYGLYETDHLRQLDPANNFSKQLVYYNEGIFLHRAFIRGGVRFCPSAVLLYNSETAAAKIPSRRLLLSFLKYSTESHKLFLRSAYPGGQKLQLLRTLGKSHYPYIRRLLKQSLRNRIGG